MWSGVLPGYGTVGDPPARQSGPITISVLTMSPYVNTTYPLFVGISPRSNTQDLGCTTRLAMNLTLVAQGLPLQCGGVWETLGPIDLSRLGAPLGATYHVQLEGYRDLFGGFSSARIACLRVTTEQQGSSVGELAWSRVKSLYK